MGSTHGPEEAASRLLELIPKFLEDRTAEISTLLTFNEQQGNAPPPFSRQPGPTVGCATRASFTGLILQCL